ncbi:MAG: EAL domain-containing protein, partial [Burkholderiaceae bacterium]
GTYALGWDGQWLGYALSPDWQPLLRKFILAAHYLVSHTLFTQLFRNRDEHHTWPLKILQWLGVLQLAAAFVLPWGSFKVLSALVWGSALAGCVFLLLRRAARHPERLLSWRSLSLAMALAVIITVLVLTLVGQQELLDSFVSVLALLLSNVMVALVVGGVIREWKNERIRAQTDLVTGYAVTPLGLFTLDGNDHFVQMNSALRDMLGQKSDASATLNWGDFFDAQSWAQVAEATLAGKEIEIHLLSGTQPRHFALRAALVDDHVEGSLQDITARSHAMDELRDQADSDPLTHTLNRRGIEKELNQALEKLQSSQAPCSLAYMNLDHFKRINGLFGHTAGDEILKQVTGRLREVLTSEQPLGRIGSDEFVILFPNMDAAQAQFVAERVIGGLNSTSYQVGHRYFQVRSAIGVVEVDPSMDAAAAISAATRACRDARRLHQDVVVYELDSSELHAHTEELRLFDQLEGGASPKGLYLEMQPIMALKNPAESLNFEILLRVRDSEGGLISTGKIVSAAEESGIITIIDKWVFSATLEWLAKHEDRLRRTRFVNVNLSGVSLNDDKFIENLFQVLARHPQLARRLCVEITEGVALQNFERTRKLIARLQSMGVRIALDDFGAGYTSFSYLSQLGADAIKIDGALVRDMLANETNIAIVRTIVELAQNLRMISIAEWVEDIPTLEALRDMGVDYIQGYVVSAALTPMQILDAESVPELITNPDTLSYIRRNYPL